MRGTTSEMAGILSETEVHFGFPYGDAKLYVFLVKREGQTAAGLQIRKGQFDCSFRGCKIAMKFDTGKVQTFDAERSDDSDMLFIFNASGFISQLRRAKQVIIEASFFRNGTRQFTFDVQGLNWPPRKQ